MFTPAMIASRVSALFRVIISYALATPRSPFDEAITAGRPANAADSGGCRSVMETNVDAESGLESVMPAAAAAPAPRNSRREIVIFVRRRWGGSASHNVIRQCSFTRTMSDQLRSADNLDTAGRSDPAQHHPATRRERDLLGEREVPGTALYGVQTLRAIENFAISGVELREFPTLIAATAAVKEAAAEANRELGLLDSETAEAIIDACREIRNETPRPLPRGHDSGWRRHVDEHERQRGDREPRAGAPRSSARQLRHREPELAREPQPVHERRLPDGGETGDAHEHRPAPVSDGRAGRSISDERRGIRAVSQDGPHSASGRGTHDPRPGVHGVRAHDSRGRRPPGRGADADPRDQHGRYRNRYGDYRNTWVRRKCSPTSLEDHRSRAHHGTRSGGGDVGYGSVRPALRSSQAMRCKAVEDLQRSSSS